MPQPDKEIKEEAGDVLSRLPENMRRKEKPNLPEIIPKTRISSLFASFSRNIRFEFKQ